MRSPNTSQARLLAGLLAALGWSALGGEFWFLLAENHRPQFGHAAVEFLSFFTVISNLLVATILTVWAIRPASVNVKLWGGRISAAAVVYILLTGLVYTLFLRQSHGDWLGLAVDIVLHQLVPAGYLALWIAVLPKTPLTWRDAFRWLIFPLAFAIASMVRGAITAEYTYAFLNADRLGYPRVALIVWLLSLPLLGLGFAVVGLNRKLLPMLDPAGED